MNYRHLAHNHLKAAEEELTSGSDHRLKFAALELRMAMEALTYDRAIAYKDEFPPSEYETWQPRKVMSVLLEIDPNADKDSSVAIGTEEEYGVPAPKMTSLGTEKVLGMKTLKKHYDALGSYLHVQSMKKSRSGVQLDYEKFRKRCSEICAFVSEVLSSPLFNVTFGNFSTLSCMECGNSIRKRLQDGQKEVVAKCYKCRATYTLLDEGEGKIKWTPHQYEIKCGNTSCQKKSVVWQHELELGRHWTCSDCGGENKFVLAVHYSDEPS